MQASRLIIRSHWGKNKGRKEGGGGERREREREGEKRGLELASGPIRKEAEVVRLKERKRNGRNEEKEGRERGGGRNRTL